MHTGYDSYWMCQNSRHELVLSLPKNDNYGHAVLTDRYKQMQIGGYPSHLNSFISPQSEVASTHPNNQHRTRASQYMWPTETYLMPSKSSFVNNYHVQEANNLNYSPQNSQAQHNCRLRYPKNPNVNVFHVYNQNKINHLNNPADSALTNGNEKSNVPISRIRVKDVFSLNNNIYDPSSSSSILKAPSIEQNGYDYEANGQNKAGDPETQAEFFDYRKVNLHQSNYLPSYYERAPAQQPHEVVRQSHSYYQQNVEFLLENPFQYETGRLIESNLHEEDASKTNSISSTLGQIRASKPTHPPKAQCLKKNSCNASQTNERVKIIPKRNLVELNNLEPINASGHLVSAETNKRSIEESLTLTSVTQNPKDKRRNQSKTFGADSFNSDSTSAAPTINVLANAPNPLCPPGPLCERVRMPENTTIKISVPHTGQNSFITIGGSSNNCNNARSSLSSLLESNDRFFENVKNKTSYSNKAEEAMNLSFHQSNEHRLFNDQIPSVPSHISNSPAKSHENSECAPQSSGIISRRTVDFPKEPFIDVNKENLRNFLNSDESSKNISEDWCSEFESDTKQTASHGNILINGFVLKQENDQTTGESPEAQDGGPSKGPALDVIKIEKIPVEVNVEEPVAQERDRSPPSEVHITLEKSPTTAVDDAKGVKFTNFPSENLASAPETVPNFKSDVENLISEAEFSKNKAKKKRRTKAMNKLQKKEETEEKEHGLREDYKSKINRDKLDMLIQFLKKDEETVLKPPCRKKLGVSNKGKKEIGSNSSRRKLSKTFIVKNKNNSREMISMMSHKTVQKAVELSKSSSQTPQIVRAHLERSEERKVSFELERGKTEETVKSDSSQESQPQKTESSKSEANIPSVSEEPSDQFSSEKERAIHEETTAVNTMRALQKLKTHFCISCNLVSSIDSFWVNVVTAELRCLNCFKKMVLKAEESTLKTKTCSCGSINFQAKTAPTGRSREEQEAIAHDPGKGSDLNLGKLVFVERSTNTEPELTANGSNSIEERNHSLKVSETPPSNLRQNLPKEARPSEKEKTLDQCEKRNILKENVAPPKKSISKENFPSLKSQAWNHSKQSQAELLENSERKINMETFKKDEWNHSCRKGCAKEQGVGGRAQILEGATSEKSIKRSELKEMEMTDRKGTDSEAQSRKRIISSLVSEEPMKKDGKKEGDAAVKFIKRTKGHHFHKELKNAKYNHPDQSNTQNPSVDCCTCHKPKAEPPRPEESNFKSASNSKIPPESNNSDKMKKLERTDQPRKRKNSCEEVSTHKVRIIESNTKRDIKPGTHSSDKTRTFGFSREDTLSYKSSERQVVKSSGDKSKKEDGENSKKDTKETVDFAEKLKSFLTQQKTKLSEHSKQKIGDSIEIPRRKSKESSDQQGKKSNSKEDFGSPKPQFPDVSKKICHSSCVSESAEKRKPEEKEKKHTLARIPKMSFSDNRETVATADVWHLRKTGPESQAFQEKQNNKIRSTSTSKEGFHEGRREPQTKRERKEKKKEREEETGRQASDGNTRKEGSWEKKKLPVSGEAKSNRTENRHARGSWKAVESSVGGKVEEKTPKEVRDSYEKKQTATLLAKLIKKTKKLSWSLLSES